MPHIDKIIAFIATDGGEDDEGIVAHYTPTGWVPMIAGDMARVESLRAIAQQTADAQGKPIKMIEFAVRREIETLEPAILDVQDPDSRVLLTHFEKCEQCGQNILVTIDTTTGPKSCKEHN